jgi:hypothetical protein
MTRDLSPAAKQALAEAGVNAAHKLCDDACDQEDAKPQTDGFWRALNCWIKRVVELEKRVAELELSKPLFSRRQLQEENDLMRETLEAIEAWSHAYPYTAFPEPDLEKAHELLKAGGMTLDALSASAMRHVVTEVGKMARAALARRQSHQGEIDVRSDQFPQGADRKALA